MTPSQAHDNDANAAEDLRLLADSARDFAIIITDADRHVLRWSAGAETILGWTQEEAQSYDTADFIFTPEDRAAGAPQQEQETALREGRAADERWHLRKDGTLFFASGVMTPLYDPQTGALRGFGKVLRDITERRRMEAELRSSAEALQVSQAQLRQANETLAAQVAARTAQLHDLNRRLLSRVEEERRRVSRELHDQTGQHLAAIGLELGTIENAAIAIRETARKAAQAAAQAARAAHAAAQAAQTVAEAAALVESGSEVVRLARVASEEARTVAISGTDAVAAAASADAALGAVEELAPRIAQIRELTNVLSRDIHRIAVDLRPTSLDDLGLIAALQTYAQEFRRRTEVMVDFFSIGIEEDSVGVSTTRSATRRLPFDMETALYRIVQEALTNVTKHAPGATRVGITLQRREGYIQVTIEDNGPGFDVKTQGAGRLGLKGMQERASLLGGTLEVESAPGKGTTIYARLPITTLLPEAD